MQLKTLSAIIIIPIAFSISCFGQQPPVRWNFSTTRITPSDWAIHISASLRPGWHIYSQYLTEGGPMPTTIKLHDTKEYVQQGKAVEQGERIHFYDSLYEMNIMWYANQVTFIQSVKLQEPVDSVSGAIDYMTCNEHQCIPHREEFTVFLPVYKKH